jgi:transposase
VSSFNPNSCMGVRARTSKEGNWRMAQKVGIVGIDISKRKADGFIRALDATLSKPSTPAGRAEMIGWLRENGVGMAVMEASGGYERDWAEALREAGLAVSIVDPKRVRYFAKSAGRLAKSDPIDAEMIAWYAEIFAGQTRRQAHDADREVLDQLMTARALLKRVETQIDQLCEHKQPPAVVKAQQALAKTIKGQLAKIEVVIAALVQANPAFAERDKIIQSVPGVGTIFAAAAIAWLPELGHISNKEIAALVGTAPYVDDSGEHKGERHIKGGRREIRDLLYMVTLGAATRHNPVLKAHYQQLRARGKLKKVALVACMRKLLVILNTMLARQQTWNPPAVAVVAAGSTPA